MWFRVVAVVTAGIFEDALFLGYAFNRLTRLTGSYWLAGIVTVAVVSLLHLPHWGVGPVLTYFVAIGAATGFFVWRQDLLANIVAHVDRRRHGPRHYPGFLTRSVTTRGITNEDVRCMAAPQALAADGAWCRREAPGLKRHALEPPAGRKAHDGRGCGQEKIPRSDTDAC